MPLGLEMGELLMKVLRLLLQLVLNLKMKHDSPGYPTTPDDQPSEKSPSTASATGRFGPGVAIVCVEEPPAVHTRLDLTRIESLVEKGYQRSAWIIAS